MKKKLSLVLIAIFFVMIMFFIAYFYIKKPSAEIIEAGNEFDVDANTFPETPMTAVYLWKNALEFANKNSKVLLPHLFYYLNAYECEFFDGNNLYLCKFEDSRIVFSNPLDGNIIFNASPGKVSKQPIVFPTGEKFFVYMLPDKKHAFLLFAAGKYELQFGNSLIFEGTDLDGDKKADVPYYWPSVLNNDEAGIAIFGIKACSKETNVKFFVDTKEHLLADSKLKYSVIFKTDDQWYGLKGNRVVGFGKIIVIIKNNGKLVVRMPASKKLAEEIEQK